jgi:AcrR family transcriptional regulator
LEKPENGQDVKWKALLAAMAKREPAPEKHKQQRSRSRREEILKAAARVFAREGIARARIAHIAAEAGVPLSSVYDYFADKESIAYALPIVHMGNFFAEFSERAVAKATARERLHLYLRLTADYARRHQEWARTLYLEIWPSVMVATADARGSLDDYLRLLLELIRDGERSGEWTDSNAHQTATIFVGATSQLIVTWLLFRQPRDIMRATDPLVARLMTLLPPAKARVADVRHKASSSGDRRGKSAAAAKRPARAHRNGIRPAATGRDG